MFIGTCSDIEDKTETDTDRPADNIVHIESELSPNTKYYWKVVANDKNGGKTESSVWNFTTE